MIDSKKVMKGLECCVRSNTDCDCPEECPYYEICWDDHDGTLMGTILMSDALELLKEQSAIIDALLKVGYPHNFQREEPWIVNYMLNITDVVRKAINLRNSEGVKQDG